MNIFLVAPTLSADMLLIIALFAFFLIAIGILTKYKIFLIFSIGVLAVLLVQFSDHVGIVITIIGLIIFNLWYATVGDNI